MFTYISWASLFLVLAFGSSTVDPSDKREIRPGCAVDKSWEAGLRSYIPASTIKPVPKTLFYDRQGRQLSIENYRGRAVVLNFWATWCPPCVKEMPALDRMKVALADDGIDVLAVSEDTKGIEHVEKYYKKLGLKHLELLMDRDGALMQAARVSSLPTTLLIDKVGNEVAAVLKDAEWDSPAIIEFVKSCLNGPQP